MKLSKIRISNFQCFDQTKAEIDFEEELTALIGLNGSGKTSTLQALSRMFGVSESTRKIKVDDFHSPSVTEQRADELSIEAWFTFPEIKSEGEMIAVAGMFNQLCFKSSGNEMMLRLRLEAKLTVDDISPDGVVDETVYYVLSDSDTYDNDKCRELRRSDRNNIQVHYIPASRNPFKEISSSTKMLLGRLLNAIQWDQSANGELQKALDLTEKASEEISKNSAIKLIEKQLQISWQEMYSGDYLSKAKVNFLPLQTDELLKTITLSTLDWVLHREIQLSQKYSYQISKMSCTNLWPEQLRLTLRSILPVWLF